MAVSVAVGVRENIAVTEGMRNGTVAELAMVADAVRAAEPPVAEGRGEGFEAVGLADRHSVEDLRVTVATALIDATLADAVADGDDHATHASATKPGFPTAFTAPPL